MAARNGGGAVGPDTDACRCGVRVLSNPVIPVCGAWGNFILLCHPVNARDPRVRRMG